MSGTESPGKLKSKSIEAKTWKKVIYKLDLKDNGIENLF